MSHNTDSLLELPLGSQDVRLSAPAAVAGPPRRCRPDLPASTRSDRCLAPISLALAVQRLRPSELLEQDNAGSAAGRSAECYRRPCRRSHDARMSIRTGAVTEHVEDGELSAPSAHAEDDGGLLVEGSQLIIAG